MVAGDSGHLAVMDFSLHSRRAPARNGSRAALQTCRFLRRAQKLLRCRKLVRDGIDPIEQRKADRAARTAAAARTITFDECVGAYLAAHRDEWRSEKHAKFWDQPLRQISRRMLGKLPVAQIDTAVLMKALLPMWERIPTTASRVRERIENILDWATVSGYRREKIPRAGEGTLSTCYHQPAR